jgi:hypothetical protein
MFKLLKKGAKGFYAGLVVLLLIIPLGIPMLLLIGFMKVLREKRKLKMYIKTNRDGVEL